MNRTETVIADKDGLYIFAECPHCNEPMAMIPLGSGHVDIPKCYCRGANGLSFKIKCCYVLNCIKKHGTICNVNQPTKKEYIPGKWNVLVVEPKEEPIATNLL